MILHIRNGDKLFEIEVPDGSWVEPSAAGRPVLMLPGPRAEDTATWLIAPQIVGAARNRHYGLRLISERWLNNTASRSESSQRIAV